MPNGHDNSKEYGSHEYGDKGTSNCRYECKCWMGPARSGGPIGLDPFGECPNNPKNGERLGGNDDYEIVVTRRIRALESQSYAGKQAIERLEEIRQTPKAKLLERVEFLEEKLRKANDFFKNLKESMPQGL